MNGTDEMLSFTTRAVGLGRADPPAVSGGASPVDDPLNHRRAPDPARLALEAAAATLEGGERGYAFASGQAAVATILELIETGAHVLVSGDPRGGPYRLFESVRRRTTGLRFSYADATDRAALEEALQEDTKMVWVESLSSPLLRLADLEMVADFAKARDLISVCDNTLATPYLSRPLDHGFDIALCNATGFLNGCVEQEGGLVVMARDREFLQDKLGFLQTTIGAIQAPLESQTTRRALATLGLRMERQCDGAERIASWLAAHSRIANVRYPGLAEHPDHELARRQMRRYGSVLSAEINGTAETARGVLERLRLFGISDAFGGIESAVQHPVLMSFNSVPPEIRAGMGLSDGLVQFSIGIEEPGDLIADLAEALA